ncbi:MAG: AbrB/MazE/SpoVT family DNA-binding domain-containing protein [Candidatus Woesearchaeota archaeon]
MKKYARLVQCDKRGQIVIPKDVREELKIEEGTGFYVYTIDDEGILLKIIEPKTLEDQENIIRKISDNSDKIKLNKKNLDKSIEKYKKEELGKLKEV